MGWFFVTGANRGIGLELVRQIIQQEQNCFAASRDPEASQELKALQAQAGGLLQLVTLDVNSPVQRDAAAEKVRRIAGKLDVLINNAGIFPQGDAGGAMGKLESDPIEEAFRTNCVAPLLLAQAMRPLLMESDRGRIVNITSQMGSIENKTGGGYYAYAISKAAMNMAFRAAANDLKSDGIACVLVHPGWVKTDMGGPSAPTEPHDSARGILSIANGLTMGQSGHFIDFMGHRMPW